jgi:hypothetical protein
MQRQENVFVFLDVVAIVSSFLTTTTLAARVNHHRFERAC